MPRLLFLGLRRTCLELNEPKMQCQRLIFNFITHSAGHLSYDNPVFSKNLAVSLTRPDAAAPWHLPRRLLRIYRCISNPSWHLPIFPSTYRRIIYLSRKSPYTFRFPKYLPQNHSLVPTKSLDTSRFPKHLPQNHPLVPTCCPVIISSDCTKSTGPPATYDFRFPLHWSVTKNKLKVSTTLNAYEEAADDVSSCYQCFSRQSICEVLNFLLLQITWRDHVKSVPKIVIRIISLRDCTASR